MRSLTLLFLMAVLLSTTFAACGSATKTANSAEAGVTNASSSKAPASVATSTTGVSGSYVKEDGDTDGDDRSEPNTPGPSDDEALIANYGGKASPSETRALAALVKHYYSASLAGDGASACALLSAEVVEGLSGSTRPSACAAAISPLLTQQRRHLTAEEPATMTVIGVHRRGKIALVMLGFKRYPEGDILVEREGHAWKIDALFDSEMT